MSNKQRKALDAYLRASHALGDDNVPSLDFRDVRVVQVEMTCLGCPEQYRGRLIDRRLFYFRFRHGAAFLGLGWDEKETVLGAPGLWSTVTDGDDGVFTSERQRNEVFSSMLDELTAGEWINELS